MKHIYRVEAAIAQGYILSETRYMITAIGTFKPARGNSYAQRVLDEVLADADREGVTLILAVSPDPDTDYERLCSWYKRNGFVMFEEDAMQREPNTEQQ